MEGISGEEFASTMSRIGKAIALMNTHLLPAGFPVPAWAQGVLDVQRKIQELNLELADYIGQQEADKYLEQITQEAYGQRLNNSQYIINKLMEKVLPLRPTLYI